VRTWLALAAHYGEHILHPMESHLQCSCPVFDCGSFEVQKQSVSNAFQYVVLRPLAPSSSDDITALRADSNCKSTKIKWEKVPNRSKSYKIFRNYLDVTGIMSIFAASRWVSWLSGKFPRGSKTWSTLLQFYKRVTLKRWLFYYFV
jgi:hypothetical protein